MLGLQASVLGFPLAPRVPCLVEHFSLHPAACQISVILTLLKKTGQPLSSSTESL